MPKKTSVVSNVARLLTFEVAALFLAWYVIKTLFAFDIFDFSTGTGKIVGMALTAVVMMSIYHTVSSGEVTNIGADAAYDPNDRRRLEAKHLSLKPVLAQTMMMTESG